MKRYIIIIALALTASCKSIKIVKSNPTFSLKGLHMWDEHRGYTKQDWIDHPDYNCKKQ